MKKILVLIFVLTFIFVFASCVNDKTSDSISGSSSKDATSKDASSKASESSTTDTKDTTSKSTEIVGTEITFTLQNFSDVAFKSLTISEAGKKSWSDNLLVETVNPNITTTITIKLPSDTEKREFDLLATDTNGEATTFKLLNLSEATDKGGNIVLYISEGGGANAFFEQPYTQPTLVLDSAPTKTKYKVAEAYDPSGFSATYTDEDGVSTTLGPNDVKFIVSKTVEITAGRPFTSAGKKVVVVKYNGLEIEFELIVE